MASLTRTGSGQRWLPAWEVRDLAELPDANYGSNEDHPALQTHPGANGPVPADEASTTQVITLPFGTWTQHLAVHRPEGALQHEEHDKAETKGESEEAEAGEGRMVNIAVAFTLLGGVAFVMGIFYMVNHSDIDMRLYSWGVVSTTISIFVSILFFRAALGIIDVWCHWGAEESRHWLHLLAHGLFMVFWVMLLHVLIAHKSYQVAAASTSKSGLATTSLMQGMGEEASEEVPMTEEQEQSLVSWVTLLSHICGFAAIFTGVALQEAVLDPVPEDTRWGPAVGGVASIITLAMSFGSLFLLFRLSDVLRTKYFATTRPMLSLWDRFAEEAENDVGALALSFLVAQAVCYVITGVLPGPEGDEGDHHYYGIWSICQMLISAGLFGLLRMLMIRVARTLTGHHEHEASMGMQWREYWMRWLFILQDTIAMCLAWCVLWAATWLVARELVKLHLVELGFTSDCAVVRMVLAMVVSILAFFIILVLDWLSDMQEGDDERALRSIISCLGVLVGFSWEGAFGKGVEVIAELTDSQSMWYPVFVRLAIALCIGIVVIPAWRMYILRALLKLEREHRAHHARIHSEEGPEVDELLSVSQDTETTRQSDAGAGDSAMVSQWHDQVFHTQLVQTRSGPETPVTIASVGAQRLVPGAEVGHTMNDDNTMAFDAEAITVCSKELNTMLLSTLVKKGRADK